MLEHNSTNLITQVEVFIHFNAGMLCYIFVFKQDYKSTAMLAALRGQCHLDTAKC